MKGPADLGNLRDGERAKFDAAREVCELGCTDTAYRRGRAKLGCTRKTLRKYVGWYQSGDVSAFAHHNRGRKPPTTVDGKTRERIVSLYKDSYSGANYTHFREILEEDHGITVSDGTLHSIMKGSYIVSPRSTRRTKRDMERRLRSIARKADLTRRQARDVDYAFALVDGEDAHPRRPRSRNLGDMIQMDACEFVWVPGQGKWHLHAAVDDATGEVVGAWFDTQETLDGYYHVLHMVLTRYGIPVLFRTDRRTVFEYRKLARPDEEKDTFTQFSAACRTLGIEIEANSVPQHKGRVERLNSTLQGRIPVDLRRKGVTTMEEANRFLPDYLAEFNARFSLLDERDLEGSSFVEAPPAQDINVILSVVSHRVVDAGNSIKYQGAFYLPLIQGNGGQRRKFFPRGTKALVIRAFDGTLLANIHDEIFPLEMIEKRETACADPDPKPRKSSAHKPAPDHPWRNPFLSRKTLEAHVSPTEGRCGE
jgi:hypothetical protein